MNQKVASRFYLGFAQKMLIYAQQSTSSQSDDEDDDGDYVTLTNASRDKVAETVISQTFDQLFESHDSLLFGSRVKDLDTKTLHPPSGQILKLWQIYLENVNPLLKVTHTPTLQPRIIDAAVNIANASNSLQALMFGIYCVAILSLDDMQCENLFGSSKDSLVQSYVFACKQAMIKIAVLRSRDREGLTALFLYMVCFICPLDYLAADSLISDFFQTRDRPSSSGTFACYRGPRCSAHGP